MSQFYFAIWILVIPVALLAGWILNRRMRPMSQTKRIRLTAFLLAVDSLWIIQIFTGWSLAIPVETAFTTCIFLLFYLLSSAALWACFAGGEGSVIGRIVSVLLIVPLLPLLLFSASIGNLSSILAVGDPFYQFLGEGRVSPTVTYRMATQAALIGGAEFPAYVLYRNPRWMPLIHKKAANGALQCTPEFAHFASGKDARTVNLTCAGQLIEEIALE
jgi:hypothetical protein